MRAPDDRPGSDGEHALAGPGRGRVRPWCRSLGVNAPSIQTTAARAETMLALAEFVGISLDDLEAARCRLAHHQADYERAPDAARRKELAALLALDIAELAVAYKVLERAVARGGVA
jgi:hypothetical protein